MSADQAKDNAKVLRTLGLIGFLLVAIVLYFGILGFFAIQFIQAGGVAPTAMGIGVLMLIPLGAWIIWASLRAAFAHQHLARRMHDEGRELDTSHLERRPSGRVTREAADGLFAQVKQEWEADPDNWRSSYRLAKAYDIAGDRSRAREAMKRAVALEKLESQEN
ncbi:hypothetical protein [Nocardia camponoti]|uniref:Tetratricopeptide repeat protein n=1 Tax=Nocardia camponoti TaxID=1616106 RepID=A0A917V620_9NOCA|nr:hypothetical protein [Nocardia camponoti]GGK41933.1 hypothetical protein GCM10011591_11780 [Nocardia camponoti]